MTPQNAVLTIANAPRNIEQLAAIQKFAQRRLADDLTAAGVPVWSDNEGRAAFLICSQTERADLLHAKLLEYDAKGTNGAAKPARQPVTTAPAPTPVVPEAPAVQEPEAPAPSPVVSAGRRGARAAAPPKPAAAPPETQELGALLAEVRDAVERAHGSLASAPTNLSDALQPLQQQLNDLTGAVEASLKVQSAQMGLLVMLGQAILQASTEELMEEAQAVGAAAYKCLGGGAGKG